MSKPMSEQMQKLAARYEKATGKKFNAKTNAQKIRSMTDEELAELFEELCYDSMAHRAKYWLHWACLTGSSSQRRRNRNEL